MLKASNKITYLKDLGLIEYQKAWDYQTVLFQKNVEKKLENRRLEEQGLPTVPTENYLLFCEHPHVYTLGKSGDSDHLLINRRGLERRGATFFKTNRGGDITYHGPGQLVCYPIFDLDYFFTDIHRYLRTLEEAVILTLADYGIVAGRIKKLTGVWVGQENPRKICAMGVKTSRWVTMHGLALNVNTDLSYFEHIIPCGISDKAVTSLQKELDQVIDMKEVQGQLCKHVCQLFGVELKVESETLSF